MSGTAAAKALILAAIPVGGTGFFVAGPWAVVSIFASLVLLASAGGLWWLAVHRARRWHHLHRTAVGGTSAPAGAVHEFQNYYRTTRPPVFSERRPPRYRLMLSAASRLRRPGGRRQAAAAPPPGGDRPTMVADDMARIESLIGSAQQRSRREQLWWLVAGLAASIPIGVAINLVTG